MPVIKVGLPAKQELAGKFAPRAFQSRRIIEEKTNNR